MNLHPRKSPRVWPTVVGVALIAIGALLGSGFVYEQSLNVRKQSVDAQLKAFRDAFALSRDLQRLNDAGLAVPNTGDVTQADREAITTALDFLYVRNQALLTNVSSSEDGTDSGRVLTDTVSQLISQSDEALALGESAYLRDTILNNVDLVTGELFMFVDIQYFKQGEAIQSQGATLERLTFTAIGLVWVMSAAAIGALLLYRRATLARDERQQAEEKAQFLAYFDPMTGLANRTRFRQVSEEIFEKEDADPMVLLFDLDDFKGVNDKFGHSAGDAVLINAANNIQQIAQSAGGTASRLGGDEFAAIIPGPISSMKAAAICEQVLHEALTPVEVDGARLSVGMSIGIAFRRSVGLVQGDIISAVQKAADVALYRAKEKGKRTYAFYDADLADLVERRRDLEHGISDALANDGFSLAFQPQIDLKTGEVKGFEALCRWYRDGVSVSPAEFISVAEATGQVVDIDIWGLNQAVSTAVAWIDKGHLPMAVSANLSALHFQSREIVDTVKSILQKTGLPPHLLTLEITESVLIDDVNQVIGILKRLRRLGVRIALDDFGTGYSSLSYLLRLDVDVIKIDQSFVRDLETRTETGVILEALVSLVQGLDKKLVVEGIETEAQAKIVRELGCHYGQGYLFGRPIKDEDAREMVPLVSETLTTRKA